MEYKEEILNIKEEMIKHIESENRHDFLVCFFKIDELLKNNIDHYVLYMEAYNNSKEGENPYLNALATIK